MKFQLIFDKGITILLMSLISNELMHNNQVTIANFLVAGVKLFFFTLLECQGKYFICKYSNNNNNVFLIVDTYNSIKYQFGYEQQIVVKSIISKISYYIES